MMRLKFKLRISTSKRAAAPAYYGVVRVRVSPPGRRHHRRNATFRGLTFLWRPWQQSQLMSLSNHHLPSSVLCRTITRSTLACRLSRRPQYLLPRTSASSPCLYARQQPLTSRRNMSSSPSTTTRSNRLANAKSPYLLQHADNPVRFELSRSPSVRAA